MMIILYYDEVKFPVLQYPYVCICRCAYRIPQTILIHFFSWNYAHFELRNLTKNERYHLNSLSAQLHRNRSTEFRECLYMWMTYRIDVHIKFHRKFWFIFLSQNYTRFELRNLTKMKDTIETVRQRNSSEAAQQNFLKLCSYEGHKM